MCSRGLVTVKAVDEMSSASGRASIRCVGSIVTDLSVRADWCIPARQTVLKLQMSTPGACDFSGFIK